MYMYELNDLMFLIKTLKFPLAHLDISKYIQFANHSSYKSNLHTQLELCHHRATSSSYHYLYFNRIICLWNSMPVIDLTLSLDIIKTQLTNYCLWSKFNDNFTSDSSCTFHLLCPYHRCSKLPITPNYQI